MEKTTAAKRRYRTLDVLKGVCILMVIVTHFEWTDEERLRALFPFWIDMAVPCFMIISGFLYAKSFRRKEIDSFVGERCDFCFSRIVVLRSEGAAFAPYQPKAVWNDERKNRLNDGSRRAGGGRGGFVALASTRKESGNRFDAVFRSEPRNAIRCASSSGERRARFRRFMRFPSI